MDKESYTDMKRKIECIYDNEINDNDYSSDDCEDTVDIVNKVVELKKFSDSQPKQRTDGWFKLRKTRITASDVGSCLKKNFIVTEDFINSFSLENYRTSNITFCNPYSNEKDFILKKNGYGKFQGNVATEWGNKYEDSAIRLYEQIKKEKVIEFGLLLHPTVDWLACSPDGITEGGVMLEIKCPFKRKLTGVPPIYYWIQVQIQLEVCDLNYCDYMECEIEEITQEQFLSNEMETSFFVENQKEDKLVDINTKGAVVEINGKFFYPPGHYSTKKEILKWVSKKSNKYFRLNPNDKDKLKVNFYRIKRYTMVNIKRNKYWFGKIKPLLEKTWKKVENFNFEDYKDYWEQKNNIEEEEPVVFNECLL